MGGMTTAGDLMLGSSGSAASPGANSRTPEQRSEGPSGSPPAWARTPTRIRWGRVLVFGLGAALAGGVAWGLIAAATGYIFGLAAAVIGGVVAYAVKKGAGRVTVGVIILAVLLTLFSVFLGEITSLSIIFAPFGATPVDIIALYPTLVAEFPGDTLPAYGFSMFGVFVAASSLWRQMREERVAAEIPLPPPAPLGTAPASPTAVPTVDVRERKTTKVAVDVHVASPEPHAISADFSAWTGSAIVNLDGRPFTKVRVWTTKVVNVPIENSPHTVTLKFGSDAMNRPKVDVLYDGRMISRT